MSVAVLAALAVAFAAAQQAHWTDKVFFETRLCGQPVPRLEALRAELSALPPQSPESAHALLDILGRFFSQDASVPVVGGCHPGGAFEAVDPAELARLAAGNKAALDRTAALAGRLRAPDNYEALWRYHLGLAMGPRSRRGRRQLKRAYELYRRWYADHDGGDDNRYYQDVLGMLRVKPPVEMPLARTADHCGDGRAYSLATRAPAPHEQKWLATLINAAHSCCGLGDEFGEKVTSAELAAILEEPRFKPWAGAAVAKALAELAQDHQDDMSQAAPGVQDRQRARQKALLARLKKRFRLKARRITGANC